MDHITADPVPSLSEADVCLGRVVKDKFIASQPDPESFREAEPVKDLVAYADEGVTPERLSVGGVERNDRFEAAEDQCRMPAVFSGHGILTFAHFQKPLCLRYLVSVPVLAAFVIDAGLIFNFHSQCKNMGMTSQKMSEYKLLMKFML